MLVSCNFDDSNNSVVNLSFSWYFLQDNQTYYKITCSTGTASWKWTSKLKKGKYTSKNLKWSKILLMRLVFFPLWENSLCGHLIQRISEWTDTELCGWTYKELWAESGLEPATLWTTHAWSRPSNELSEV